MNKPAKICTNCGERKAIGEFHSAAMKPLGVKSRCKHCECASARAAYWANRKEKLAQCKKYKESPKGKATRKKYVASNREKLNRISKHWQHADRRRNPAKWLCKMAKRRAMATGLPFSITVEDVLVPKCCPVLGIPLVVGNGKPSQNSPTLDRILPHKGYVKGNVVVVSRKANAMKNNASFAELKRLVAFYKPLMS